MANWQIPQNFQGLFVEGSSFVYHAYSILPMPVALKFNTMPWEVTVFNETSLLGRRFSLRSW